jgi:hypothetical protein
MTNRLVSVVLDLLSDGAEHSVYDLHREACLAYGKHVSEGNIGARCRDLRKVKYGAHTIKSRLDKNGVCFYQLIKSQVITAEEAERVLMA